MGSCKPEGKTAAEDQGFYTWEPAPAALQVCKDSRAAVMSQYPLCFGSAWFKSRIRFNFKIDTIYIDNSFIEHLPQFFSLLDEEARRSLRYLAIDATEFLCDAHDVLLPLSEMLHERPDETPLWARGFQLALEDSITSLRGLKEIMLSRFRAHDPWLRGSRRARCSPC